MKKICYLIIDRKNGTIEEAHYNQSKAEKQADDLSNTRIVDELLKKYPDEEDFMNSFFPADLAEEEEELKKRGDDYYVDKYDLSAKCYDEDERQIIEDLLKTEKKVAD